MTTARRGESEGEKTEQLASLEAPDDEGASHWLRRNRITRWRERVGPRPAVHHLAEDDEEEQVFGGLDHLVPRNFGGAQWTWKKATVVVDSGAAENVT